MLIYKRILKYYLRNIQKNIIFVLLNKSNKEMDKKQIKKDITVQIGMLKMKLGQYKALQELTNKSFEKEIDELLDRLSTLKKLEKELED